LIIFLYSLFNVKVKLRNDMPDDMLKDAIETSRRIIQGVTDFEAEGWDLRRRTTVLCCINFNFFHRLGLR
jgi:hypothetical protein